MTGVAAIALCAAFTSCSKNEELYDANAAKGISTEQAIAKVYDNYNQAFIKTFGQPAANQDWGFGSSQAKTRTYNVQGNLWHLPKPQGMNLEYDAKVTTDEKNKVFNYVNDPTNVETVNQIPYTDYWVSQIWNGKNDANASGVKAPNSESYPDQNGTKTSIVGGGQMDKLMIKESANGDWIHCNNFNAADNENYKEDGEGGRTLMISSGTYSFGYTNSDGSHFSEKYIIVPGEKIDPSLAGFYYVCFDFEKAYTAEEQAAERSYGTCEVWKSQATQQNPDAGYWQSGENWNLPGFYKDANSAELKTLLENEKNTKVQNITFKGYLEGNHHFAGDGVYNDWIVRVSPAEVIQTSDWEFRVIAEDLNAAALDAEQAKDGLTDSDWDFNDVVFDVKYKNDNTAIVKVRVVGGILPLYIGTATNPKLKEVHQLFGQTPNAEGQYSIIGARDSEEFEVAGVEKSQNGKDIRISVARQLQGGEEAILELKAERGLPAAKIRVKTTFTPCGERDDIRTIYPNFSAWVQSNDPNMTWY